MRMPVAGALACALAVLGFAAPASARPRAVIAFLPPGPGETRPLLEEFAARGMAIGMTSPTVGGFKARQMGLDMSQGTRIPTRLYSKPIGALVPRGGRLVGWDVALRRAGRAPGDVRPGLLATTVETAGGKVGYATGGGFSIAPIVAANERGSVTQIKGLSDLGSGVTLAVVGLAPGAAGLGELDRLLEDVPFVYVVRAPYGKKLRLLPAGLKAPGVRGELRSATTRRNGLIAATDVAPTVLNALGIRIPGAMQGEVMEGRGPADATAVEEMSERLAVVTSRRGDVLAWLGASWLVWLLAATAWRASLGRRGRGASRAGRTGASRAGRLAGERAVMAALRGGLLAGLWLPGTALLAGALDPSRLMEGAIVGLGAVALAVVTDRFVRWPLAAAVPAAVVFAAHAADLAAGSKLIGYSVAGPNPAGGARFFGIGNELETLLSLSVLIGAGSFLAGRRANAPIGFAVAAVVAGGVMGAGRLGADVGAVITLGAGGAAAVIASLPGPVTRRRIAFGIAAPVVALLALIAIDLVTGGGAHLTKSVLRAQGSEDLLDVVRRRFSSSFANLGHPVWALVFALAAAAVAWTATRVREVHEGVPRPLAAGLIGAWFATVVAAISNDSGPLILEIGAIFLLLALIHVRNRPETRVEPAP